MAIGTPILISESDEINIQKLRPVAFSREDQSSFDETLLQIMVLTS